MKTTELLYIYWPLRRCEGGVIHFSVCGCLGQLETAGVIVGRRDGAERFPWNGSTKTVLTLHHRIGKTMPSHLPRVWLKKREVRS